MKPNDRVRLRDNPGRVGTITGQTRPRRNLLYWQIRFDDGQAQYFAEDSLEAIPDSKEDPLDLLQAGRLGRPDDLRRTLTHVRLTGRLADVIYSMDTTGTDFYAHQFKPVLKLVSSTSQGILIADEVGLGKTIEAGLIWTELRQRLEYRRLFVLCPAVLREKWRRELAVRFGVDADIVNAREALLRLSDAAEKGHTARFALIASMQGTRPPRNWDDDDDLPRNSATAELARFLRSREHEESLIDMTIIDEAHYLRNPEAMTSKLGRLVRDVSQHAVLLSATPVHLRNRDLFQLVNLIDAGAFHGPQAFTDILEANAPLVKAREAVLSGKATAESVVEALDSARQHHLLRGSRQLKSILDSPPSDAALRDPQSVAHFARRLDGVNLLGHVVTRTRKRDVTEWRVKRDVQAVEVTLAHPAEREFYDAVTDLVREYCGKANAHEGFLLVTPQRQMSSSIPAAFRFWSSRQQLREEAEEDLFEDVGVDNLTGELLEEDVGPLVAAIVSRVSALADYELLAKNDSKYASLHRLLRQLFDRYPDEPLKIVLFSYFRATLDYLHERLSRDGIRTINLRGGMGNKDEVIDEFRESDFPQVLLSTEVGSEGIDLQFSWVVVNYDLPWNPMRVEQRIGRVDRLGQKSKRIVVRNLICADTIDARIYDRLYRRLQLFETSLGALEPVLGAKIRTLTMELLRRDLDPQEEIEMIEQTRQALENIRLHEEDLEENASHLVAYGDYILNQVKAARELSRCITARDIQSYVIDHMRGRYPGCDFRQELDEEHDFIVGLSNEAKHRLAQFVRTRRLEATTHLTRNDLATVRCRFENTAIPQRSGQIEVISQFHSLVRFVSHDIEESGEPGHPAVAIRLAPDLAPHGVVPGDYAFGAQRWSFQGLQQIERLQFAAAPLDDHHALLSQDMAERLIVTAANEGKDWLSAADDVELERVYSIANEVCFAALEDAFEEAHEEIENENLDRADVQERTLERHYEQQRTSLEGIAEIHRSKGRRALVSATLGRIRVLEQKFERRRLDINERRRLESSRDEIAAGVIRIEGARWN